MSKYAILKSAMMVSILYSGILAEPHKPSINQHYVGQPLSEALRLNPSLQLGVHALMKGHSEGAWANKYEGRNVVIIFAKDDLAWSVSGDSLLFGSGALKKGMSRDDARAIVGSDPVRETSSTDTWIADNVTIFVSYDRDTVTGLYIEKRESTTKADRP